MVEVSCTTDCRFLAILYHSAVSTKVYYVHADYQSEWVILSMHFLQQSVDNGQKKPAQMQKEVQQVRDKVRLMNKKGSVKEGEPPLPKGNYYRIWRCQPTVEGTMEESSLEIRKPVKWEMLQRERVLTLLSQLDPSRVTLSSISVVSACVL